MVLHLISPVRDPLRGDRAHHEQLVVNLWVHGGHLEQQMPPEMAPHNHWNEMEELLGVQSYHWQVDEDGRQQEQQDDHLKAVHVMVLQG